MGFEVEVRTVDGTPTAIGSAGPRSLVVDRPVEDIAEIPATLRAGASVRRVVG